MWKSKSASDKRPTNTASASGGSSVAPRGAELPAGAGSTAKMEPKRSIVEADCSKPIDFTQGGNLRCKKR